MAGRALLWASLLLLLFLVACRTVETPSLEDRARAIARSLMCPICQGQTVDQSQVPLARQMRALIREKLEQGWTDQQIIQFIVDRYGERVLAAPPRRGIGLLAWVVPPLVVAVGVGVLALVVRAMARRRAPAPPLLQEEVEYLSLIEAERRGGPPPGRPSP